MVLLRPQQDRRKRRRQSQRIERRNRNGKRNRKRKLLVKNSRSPRKKLTGINTEISTSEVAITALVTSAIAILVAW